MSRFSLRTLFLTLSGVSVVLALLVSLRVSPSLAHLLLVLAFAVPGGSYGFDVGQSSRSAAIGTCVAAVAGTLLLSGLVLALDFWRLW